MYVLSTDAQHYNKLTLEIDNSSKWKNYLSQYLSIADFLQKGLYDNAGVCNTKISF
jgi:hypothetical protein